MRKAIFLLALFFTFNVQSQIVIDNLAPYNSPIYLVDNVLLGGGVVASNHTYQGESSQIGWFNASNTNLGIDSGIVMCTGDVYALDPINGGGFPILPNIVTDPDLLAVANSVPGMIGQSFSVSSINDVAILEFDFIPTSDSMEFRYAFGSQEYFTYENTQYNDVFGFFLSGPGIAGPWANGAINLAVVPNTNPPLPITISSICNDPPDVMNPQYFVNNQAGLNIIADADGFTTVLTAQALVQCGQTYHIKLAIADGSDSGLSSYVWLEGGSFFSPELTVVNDLGIDSNTISIPCNSTVQLTANGGIGANYQWFDSTSTVFSTDSFVNIGAGSYVVSADVLGCAVVSDTVNVIADPAPIIDLGADFMIPCNSDTLVNPLVYSGTAPYTYLWDSGNTDSMLVLTEGIHSVIVNDFYGCSSTDTLEIFFDLPPVVNLGANVMIPCNADTLLGPIVYGGTAPYTYLWDSGDTDSVLALSDGVYSVIVNDFYGCSDSDTIEIIYDAPPVVELASDYSIPCNTTTTLLSNVTGGTEPYSYVWSNGSAEISIDVNEGSYILTVSDSYGCSDSDEISITEDPIPHATISGGGSVCDDGSTVDINFTFDGLLPWDLTYTNGSVVSSVNNIIESSYSFSTLNAGNYEIVLANDANNCVADTSIFGDVRVTIHPLPQPTISPIEVEIYEGEEIELSVGEYTYYEWFLDGNTLVDTMAALMVSDSGIFYVRVVDENGCVDISGPATVHIAPLTQLFIPLAFTPNDDEHNELFVIQGVAVQSFSIQIFNIWGEKLFQSNNIDKSWDGTFAHNKVPTGTYYYQIEVLGEDARLFEKSGTIEVLY